MNHIDHDIERASLSDDLQPPLTVARYLTQQIALSGSSQIEIARALGYDKPNVISMFKSGRTRLPINKIPALAAVLKIDAFHFLRLAMLEYMPETWEVFESVIGRAKMLGEGELAVVSLLRDSTGDAPPPNIDIASVRRALVGGMQAAIASEAAVTLATLEAYEAKPSNAKWK